MLSWSGNTLLDQSGNGINATFVNAPTLTTEGLTMGPATGGQYGSFSITPALAELSILAVTKVTSAGSSGVITNHVGTSGSVDGCGLTVNNSNRYDFKIKRSIYELNYAKGPTVSSSTWTAVLARVHINLGIVGKLGGGKLSRNHSPHRFNVPLALTNWRIGSNPDGSGVLASGKIALLRVYNRSISDVQEQALLGEVTGLMNARGIVLT